MKVWVLTAGYDYEGDWVVGVFSSEEKAKSVGEKYRRRNSAHMNIESFDIDIIEESDT